MTEYGETERPPPPAPGKTKGGRREEPRLRDTRTTRRKIERRIYGSVDVHRFGATMTAATAFLVVLAMSALTAGTVAGTVFGPGMGGFVAEFGIVDANEGTIYPVLDEHPACENAPEMEANLRGDVTIDDHLAFHKDLPSPDGFPADVVRLSIVAANLSQPVDSSDLSLRFTGLRTEHADLGDPGAERFEFREFGPDVWDEGNGSTDRFSQDRDFGLDDADYELGIGVEGDDAFLLRNGTAAAHHVSFAEISIPDVDLMVAAGDEGEFEGPTGVVERPVNPSERDC
ncbi:MAG: hypothetical protein ACOCSN_07280, partial [Halanaeroarchaeum sp.]